MINTIKYAIIKLGVDNMISFVKPGGLMGYLIVVLVVSLLILAAWIIRKKAKLGVYTKEEEENMKSNLDLLLQEEEVEEGKNYEDEV